MIFGKNIPSVNKTLQIDASIKHTKYTLIEVTHINISSYEDKNKFTLHCGELNHLQIHLV